MKLNNIINIIYTIRFFHLNSDTAVFMAYTFLHMCGLLCSVGALFSHLFQELIMLNQSNHEKLTSFQHLWLVFSISHLLHRFSYKVFTTIYAFYSLNIYCRWSHFSSRCLKSSLENKIGNTFEQMERFIWVLCLCL